MKYDWIMNYVNMNVMLCAAGFKDVVKITEACPDYIKCVRQLHLTDKVIIIPTDKISYLEMYAPKVKPNDVKNC